MSEKVTVQDALTGLRARVDEALEKHANVDWRIRKWVSLAEAQDEITLFDKDNKPIIKKKPVWGIQARAMENLSKIGNDYAPQGMRFEGANGEGIQFIVHYGGKPKEEREGCDGE